MRTLAIAGLAFGLALAPTVVRADEAKSAISSSMVLNLFSQPAQLGVRASARELMEPGPPPASHQAGGEVQRGRGAHTAALEVYAGEKFRIR